MRFTDGHGLRCEGSVPCSQRHPTFLPIPIVLRIYRGLFRGPGKHVLILQTVLPGLNRRSFGFLWAGASLREYLWGSIAAVASLRRVAPDVQVETASGRVLCHGRRAPPPAAAALLTGHRRSRGNAQGPQTRWGVISVTEVASSPTGLRKLRPRVI